MSEPPTNLHRAQSHDVLEAAHSWLDKDGRIALATVVGTWGSAPVGVGGQMVVAADGRFEGSVSGGCVEGEVIAEAEDILADGKPKTLEFGVADETAWQVGLPCGGKIKVFVERLEKGSGLPLIARALDARTSRRGMVVRTRLADGHREVFSRDDGRADASVLERFNTGESELTETPEGQVFLHALVPPARIIIIGATHIGQILAQLVKIAGYEVVVIDPRTAFAAEARFPGIHLDTEWPQDAIPRIGLDPYAAVVALAHVGHIDDEALKLAMRSDCFYIGALGSRRNHAKRTQRLKDAGFSEDEIKRIHSPIGFNIGAQSPQEIAISIMAELVLALRGPKVYKAADAPKAA
jgi:xanthine dehydrogenase accessory factor